jgi:lipoprotein Spr
LLTLVSLALVPIGCGSSREVSRPGSERARPAGGDRKPSRQGELSRDRRDAIVGEARRWLGTPYRYGGHSRGDGTDCSGMVMEVYQKALGLKLPRSSREQQTYCRSLRRDRLQPGDLVFFSGKGGGDVSHVGLYIGNGEMIHASTSRGVIISGLDERYYQRTYHSAGRVPVMAEDEPLQSRSPRAAAPAADKRVVKPAVNQAELDDAIDQKIDSIYSSMFD